MSRKDKGSLLSELLGVSKDVAKLEKEYLDGAYSPSRQLELVRAINAKIARIGRLEQEIDGLQPEVLLKLVS